MKSTIKTIVVVMLALTVSAFAATGTQASLNVGQHTEVVPAPDRPIPLAVNAEPIRLAQAISGYVGAGWGGSHWGVYIGVPLRRGHHGGYRPHHRFYDDYPDEWGSDYRHHPRRKKPMYWDWKSEGYDGR